jgi:hypothetical protein
VGRCCHFPAGHPWYAGDDGSSCRHAALAVTAAEGPADSAGREVDGRACRRGIFCSNRIGCGSVVAGSSCCHGRHYAASEEGYPREEGIAS